MSASPVSHESTAAATEPIRFGVVSFVNTLPLIEGLGGLADIELIHNVPSLLIEQLLGGAVDVALCSSIDYQRSPEPLVIVPAGLLGCDGPTLTVRLYSTSPIERIERVYCDTDSHTSIALMQILLRERFGIDPELISYNAREHVADSRLVDWPEAMLLIGDKVVTDSPPAVRYPHQLDLGGLWREHTATPFVFALWLARPDVDPDRLRVAGAILDRQRRRNGLRIEAIIHDRAEPRNWPRDLALAYLRERIAYEFTDDRRRGLEQFFDKAFEHGLIGERRPLELIAL
jgi:chorismate dehydratase